MEFCLALPEATCDIGDDYAAFLVRRKTFAYFLNDHHGDGIVSICTKLLPGDNKLLAQTSPERFYLPAYIGARGWVGMRLDRGPVDWSEVTELLTDSYRRIAPKGLAARTALSKAS
jgi:predicted DNA-binding protein (MmcQ/YjbR family)